MRSRVVLTWFVWIVVVGLGMNLVRLAAVRRAVSPAVQSAPETSDSRGSLAITPYTLFIYDNRPGTPAEMARGTTVIKATRSDGSHLQRLDSLNQRSPVAFRYIMLATGQEFFIDDMRQEKTVLGTKRDVRMRHRDPAADCLKTFAGEPFANGEAVIGREKLLGYDVVVVKGSRNKILWLAPALTCAQLRMRAIHSSGELLDQVVTRVLPGDPPADLFDIPDAYREVPRKQSTAAGTK
jgi:hypothetical protein